MNVEIRTCAAQFLFWEYINDISVAVFHNLNSGCTEYVSADESVKFTFIFLPFFIIYTQKSLNTDRFLVSRLNQKKKSKTLVEPLWASYPKYFTFYIQVSEA
jgi:hypothetical protein